QGIIALNYGGVCVNRRAKQLRIPRHAHRAIVEQRGTLAHHVANDLVNARLIYRYKQVAVAGQCHKSPLGGKSKTKRTRNLVSNYSRCQSGQQSNKRQQCTTFIRLRQGRAENNSEEFTYEERQAQYSKR